MLDILFPIFGFIMIIWIAIAASECALPKTPRYWLRILFEKKD